MFPRRPLDTALLWGKRGTRALSDDILIAKALPVCNAETGNPGAIEQTPPCAKFFAAEAISRARFFEVH